MSTRMTAPPVHSYRVVFWVANRRVRGVSDGPIATLVVSRSGRCRHCADAGLYTGSAGMRSGVVMVEGEPARSMDVLYAMLDRFWCKAQGEVEHFDHLDENWACIGVGADERRRRASMTPRAVLCTEVIELVVSL